jgi:hypothetical protein
MIYGINHPKETIQIPRSVGWNIDNENIQIIG